MEMEIERERERRRGDERKELKPNHIFW